MGRRGNWGCKINDGAGKGGGRKKTFLFSPLSLCPPPPPPPPLSFILQPQLRLRPSPLLCLRGLPCQCLWVSIYNVKHTLLLKIVFRLNLWSLIKSSSVHTLYASLGLRCAIYAPGNCFGFEGPTTEPLYYISTHSITIHKGTRLNTQKCLWPSDNEKKRKKNVLMMASQTPMQRGLPNPPHPPPPPPPFISLPAILLTDAWEGLGTRSPIRW